MAKSLRTRPSELVAIDEAYAAYCFDEAVFVLGSYIESELEKVEGKTMQEIEGKQTLLLNKLLSGKSRFAEPMLTG
jgi:hypothetical protein